MLKKIYEISPSFLQDLFLTAQSYKYRSFRKGGKYNDFLEMLLKTQHYSKEEIFKWQIEQFKKVFGEAYNSTVYYREIFDKAGVRPSEIEDFSFLTEMPILTKDSIRDNPSRFINKDRKIVYTARTGGTTGAPMITPFDAESVQFSYAFISRFFEQSGVKYGLRNLHMTGQQIVPGNRKKQFWRTDFLGNSLYLSIHHLGYNTFLDYWHKIVKFKPLYIFGYTSFIYDLARLVNTFGRSGQLQLLGVFPSSEMLTDVIRQEIEKAFDCQVFDHYGSTEGVPLITQCRKGSYHIVPESGIIEFVDKNGFPAKDGEPAEMIMTSLRQFARPLLRYKIGDTATFSKISCNCGLKWPCIQELTGRLSEWVVLADGRRISQFSHQVFKLASEIEESQIVQHTYQDFEILIVKKAGFNIEHENFIRKRIFQLLAAQVHLKFTYVSVIPKTSGGKKPSLISKVK